MAVNERKGDRMNDKTYTVTEAQLRAAIGYLEDSGGEYSCGLRNALRALGLPLDLPATEAVVASNYVCTMDPDCMPECCAQWRIGGQCADTGGNCRFRKRARCVEVGA
jgi:hypothetical protein